MNILKISFFCLCLLFAASGFAQKLTYGLGVGAHYGLFSLENADQISATDFKSVVNVSPALSFILDYQSTGTFSVRLQPVFTTKQIRFVEEVDGLKRSEANYLGINFISLDLGITGRFNLPLNKWQITPLAGINIGFNKHTDAIFNARANSSADLIVAQISQGNTFTSTKLSVQPGIIAGIGIGRINGKLALEAKVVITPVDLVDGDTNIPFSENVNIPLVGKFQYVGLGINYKFN